MDAMSAGVKNPDFIGSDEAAAILCIKPQTLSAWRTRKKGPKFYKISNRRVVYDREDVVDYVLGHSPEAFAAEQAQAGAAKAE